MKKHVLSLMASFALLGSTQLAQAQTGASLNFDGVNDYVDLGNTISASLNNTSNPITVEAWVYPSTTIGTGAIVGNHQGPTQFQLRRNGSNYDFMIGFGTYGVTSAATVTVNTWQHVAASYDGSSIKIYVNGVLSGSAAATGFTFPASTVPVRIGGDGFPEYFAGNIDEVRLWSGARSLGLIQQYMNCSVQDTAVGLVAYYRFNDGIANASNGSNTTLFDAGVNKYNGTLNNFALTGTSSNFSTDYFMNYFSLQSTLTDANCGNTLGGAVTADFNGDGSKDLIMIDWNGNTRMYANDGKGNFPVSYSNPITGGGYLEAADADNDGDYDLIVAGGSTVTVYANNGSGTFTAVTGNFFQGTGAANVTKVADLNGDGKKDLIVGNGGSGATDSSLIYYNTGTTGNAAFTYKFGIAPNPGRNAIDVGDVNGDGYPDIVTGGSSWGAQLLFNVNNGASFSMQTPPAGYSGGARLVDWNQDGKLDYMNYDQYNNYGLRYVLNDGSGIFSATPILLLQDYNAHYAKLADLNGDGFLDVVIDNWGGNAKAYLSNGCAVTVQNNCNYALGRADNNITLADYNGDGTIDIFCQARCNSSSVYMNYLTPVTGTPLPNVSISGNTNVNYGSSTVLTASGASAFQWSANAGSATTASVSVSPTVSTTYTVVGTNTVGCASTATVMVSINAAALDFDGTNDYVSIPQPVSGDFTIEYWVRTTQSGGSPNWYNGIGLVDAEVPGVANDFGTALVGNKFAFGVGNPDVTITSVTSINDGNWHHVAATREMSSGLMKVYVDGIMEASGTGSTNPRNAPPQITIGSMQTLISYFNGDIDEVRIWNRALCLGEIQNNMNGELTTPQSGLMAYYKFNEGSASANNAGVTTANDSSGNANNGTLQNFALNGATSNWVAPGGVLTGSMSPAYVVPTLTVSGTTTICAGDNTVLTASGANTYTWTSGPSSASYTVSPTSNATYSVSGTTSLGCPTNMAMTTVTVNPAPSVTSLSGNVTLCGDVSATFSISSSGTNTYQWIYESVAPLGFDSAAINGLYTETGYTTPVLTIGQVLTGNYDHYAVYCIVTNAFNCSAVSAPDTIYATPLPIVGATVTTPTLCLGFADTLIASGAFTYTWSSNAGSTVNDSAIVSPTTNDTYTVTGTDNNGCANTATVSVTVSNCGSGIANQSHNSWSVYPNPSNGNFTLRSDSEIGAVEVRNALGEVVYKTFATSTSVQIDLTSHASGIYYLQAQGKKMMLSKQ